MVRLNQRSKRKRNGEKAKTISWGEIVVIEWVDAYEESAGWHSIEDALKMRPKPVNSVGYILKETEDYIILAGDLDPRLLKELSKEEIKKILDDSDCGRLTVIPRQWIKKNSKSSNLFYKLKIKE